MALQMVIERYRGIRDKNLQFHIACQYSEYMKMSCEERSVRRENAFYDYGLNSKDYILVDTEFSGVL